MLLGLHIAGEQLPQLGLPWRAPGKARCQHLVERRLRIDGARIDGEAGALGREALLGLGQPEIVANQIHEVGGILAVVDGEGALEPDGLRVFAQQPRADRVKRAGP